MGICDPSCHLLVVSHLLIADMTQPQISVYTNYVLLGQRGLLGVMVTTKWVLYTGVTFRL